MNSLITEYKGHLSIVTSNVFAVLAWTDALTVVEKVIAILIAIIMAVWGIRHFQSRIELNKSLKKEADTRREMAEQELYERWKKNLN
jgi:flagellar biogenesis protein FliO